LILLQAAAVLSAQSLSAPAVTNVSFKGPGNVTLKAYLAVPAGKGPFPAVWAQETRNRTLDFLKRTIGKTAGMM
jgi:hypothetical protein